MSWFTSQKPPLMRAPWPGTPPQLPFIAALAKARFCVPGFAVSRRSPNIFGYTSYTASYVGIRIVCNVSELFSSA